jgi:hypothetical protein
MIDLLAFCVTGFWKFCGIVVLLGMAGLLTIEFTKAALTGLALMIWGPKK